MRRFPLVSALCVLATVVVQGCSPAASPRVQLRTGAAEVCTTRPGLVLSARADGRYALDFSVYDSAQLVTALGNVVPPRPDRVVMVRVDTDRAKALRWIVPAIERNGGTAYQFDQACMYPTLAADRFFSGARTRPPGFTAP